MKKNLNEMNAKNSRTKQTCELEECGCGVLLINNLYANMVCKQNEKG